MSTIKLLLLPIISSILLFHCQFAFCTTKNDSTKLPSSSTNAELSQPFLPKPSLRSRSIFHQAKEQAKKSQMVDFQLEPSVNRGKSQIHGGSQMNSEKQQSLRSRSISARIVQSNSQIPQSNSQIVQSNSQIVQSSLSSRSSISVTKKSGNDLIDRQFCLKRFGESERDHPYDVELQCGTSTIWTGRHTKKCIRIVANCNSNGYDFTIIYSGGRLDICKKRYHFDILVLRNGADFMVNIRGGFLVLGYESYTRYGKSLHSKSVANTSFDEDEDTYITLYPVYSMYPVHEASIQPGKLSLSNINRVFNGPRNPSKSGTNSETIDGRRVTTQISILLCIRDWTDKERDHPYDVEFQCKDYNSEKWTTIWTGSQTEKCIRMETDLSSCSQWDHTDYTYKFIYTNGRLGKCKKSFLCKADILTNGNNIYRYMNGSDGELIQPYEYGELVGETTELMPNGMTKFYNHLGITSYGWH